MDKLNRLFLEHSEEIVKALEPFLTKGIKVSFKDGYYAPQQSELRIIVMLSIFLGCLNNQIPEEQAKQIALKVSKDVGPSILTTQALTEGMKPTPGRSNERFGLALNLISKSLLQNLGTLAPERKAGVVKSMQEAVRLFTTAIKQRPHTSSFKVSGGASFSDYISNTWVDLDPTGNSKALSGGWTLKGILGLPETEEEERDTYEEKPWYKDWWGNAGRVLKTAAKVGVAGTIAYANPALAVQLGSVFFPALYDSVVNDFKSWAPHISYDWRKWWEDNWDAKTEHNVKQIAQAALAVAPAFMIEKQQNQQAQQQWQAKQQYEKGKIERQNQEKIQDYEQKAMDVTRKNTAKQDERAIEEYNSISELDEMIAKLKKETALYAAQDYLETYEGLNPFTQESDAKTREIDALNRQWFKTLIPDIDIGIGAKTDGKKIGANVNIGKMAKDLTEHSAKIADLQDPSYKQRHAEMFEFFSNPNNRADYFKTQQEVRDNVTRWKQMEDLEKRLAALEELRNNVSSSGVEFTNLYSTNASREDITKSRNAFTKMFADARSTYDDVRKEFLKTTLGSDNQKPDRVIDTTKADALRSSINPNLPSSEMGWSDAFKEVFDPSFSLHEKRKRERARLKYQSSGIYHPDHIIDLPNMKVKAKHIPEALPPKPILLDPKKDLPPDVQVPPVASIKETMNAVTSALKGFTPYEESKKEKKDKKEELEDLHRAIDKYNEAKLEVKKKKLAAALSAPSGQARSTTLNTVVVPAVRQKKLLHVTPLQLSTTLRVGQPQVRLNLEPLVKKPRRI